MIFVNIDGFFPCLKDKKTGELVETEVVRCVRKTFLKKYNERNNWFVNWDELLDEYEVYALVIKGTSDIQGLAAMCKDDELQALYFAWAVAAPENNHLFTDHIRYSGVGGHLFAIAADKSKEYGYDGCLYGFAANEKLLKHYENKFGAEHIGIMHPYHFVINEQNAKHISEVYNYEWTEAQL